MNVPKSKIAVLTTVANFELYKKTSIYFPKGVKHYVIDGTNRMYGINSIIYMMSKFKNLGMDQATQELLNIEHIEHKRVGPSKESTQIIQEFRTTVFNSFNLLFEKYLD